MPESAVQHIVRHIECSPSGMVIRYLVSGIRIAGVYTPFWEVYSVILVMFVILAQRGQTPVRVDH